MANKLHSLVVCQANFMQVLLQKIDRRSKPIKKQEKIVAANLKRKRIQLDQENFDIINVLKQAVKSQNPPAKRSSDSVKPDFSFENPPQLKKPVSAGRLPV